MAKYNHQPFEDWVYSREAISPQEELALQEHLQGCQNCQSLVDALYEVEFSIKSEPVLSPATGFTARWQTHLAEQRARQQKRQTVRFVLINAFALVPLLALLVIFMWPIIRSPYPFLLTLVYQATLIYSFLTTFTQAGITVLRTMFSVVPMAIWVSVSIVMAGMMALWLFTFQKLVYQRRVIS
jgi:Na+/serine symporter